jgi:hypothetical protein
MIGFHRLNRYNNSKKAFKRTHIYSTVLLNLDKLRGVEYHWRAHAMEDIQFNRDANRARSCPLQMLPLRLLFTANKERGVQLHEGV